MNCPHRYLSDASIALLRRAHGGRDPNFIVGRVTAIATRRARARAAGGGAADAGGNPYGLHEGTQYYVLDVEALRGN